MTAPGFVKTSDGGYTTETQWAAYLERLESRCLDYLFACHIYYNTEHESPLTDAEFDRIQKTLEVYWDDLPQWFKDVAKDPKSLKTDAHSLVLTDDEKAAAVIWATKV